MSGAWREKGNELFQECRFPWAGAEAVRENARGLSWAPRSSLRGAVQRQVVGVLWQMNHVKWTECWKQKLQKALNFSLTALDCVIRTNYLGLKGFGGFLFCFFAYKIKAFVNSGTFVLNFFQHFPYSHFGSRIFDLRPLFFCPKTFIKTNYVTNKETKTSWILWFLINYKMLPIKPELCPFYKS